MPVQKSEIRNKFEARKLDPPQADRNLMRSLAFWILLIRICFGSRYSIFEPFEMHSVLRIAIHDSLRPTLRSVHAGRFEFAVASPAGVRLGFAFMMGVRAAQEGHFVEDVFLEPIAPEINARRCDVRDRWKQHRNRMNVALVENSEDHIHKEDRGEEQQR